MPEGRDWLLVAMVVFAILPWVLAAWAVVDSCSGHPAARQRQCACPEAPK